MRGIHSDDKYEYSIPIIPFKYELKKLEIIYIINIHQVDDWTEKIIYMIAFYNQIVEERNFGIGARN